MASSASFFVPRCIFAGGDRIHCAVCEYWLHVPLDYASRAASHLQSERHRECMLRDMPSGPVKEKWSELVELYVHTSLDSLIQCKIDAVYQYGFPGLVTPRMYQEGEVDKLRTCMILSAAHAPVSDTYGGRGRKVQQEEQGEAVYPWLPSSHSGLRRLKRHPDLHCEEKPMPERPFIFDPPPSAPVALTASEFMLNWRPPPPKPVSQPVRPLLEVKSLTHEEFMQHFLPKDEGASAPTSSSSSSSSSSPSYYPPSEVRRLQELGRCVERMRMDEQEKRQLELAVMLSCGEEVPLEELEKAGIAPVSVIEPTPRSTPMELVTESSRSFQPKNTGVPPPPGWDHLSDEEEMQMARALRESIQALEQRHQTVQVQEYPTPPPTPRGKLGKEEEE